MIALNDITVTDVPDQKIKVENDSLYRDAYIIAVEHGFEGTEEEWLESLKGADGKTPVKGVDYYTEADKAEMVKTVLKALPTYNGEVEEI